MKYSQKQNNLFFLRFLCLFFCVLLMVIAVGLYFEYEDFMHNYREINFSKIYSSTFTCISQEQIDCPSWQQKWIEGDFSAQEKDQQFVMVNRDQHYLEQDALDYAKKYNLEREVKNLYNLAFVPEHETFIARSETKAPKKLISKQPTKQPELIKACLKQNNDGQ